MKKLLNRRLILMLILVSLFASLLPAATNAEDGDSAQCVEETADYKIALDYAVEILHFHAETITIKIGRKVIGPVTTLEVEYYSFEDSDVLLWSGTITLQDNCDAGFAAKTDTWYCDTDSVDRLVEEVLAQGEGLIIVLSFDEWKEKLGPVTIEYETADLWLIYYQYVITLYAQVTETTINCTDLPEAGPRPPATTIRVWDLPHDATGVHWQYRNPQTFGLWNDVLLEDGISVFYPGIETRNRQSELQNLETNPGEWRDVKFVALVIPFGWNKTLADYRAVDGSGNPIGSWIETGCERVLPTDPCEAIELRPENPAGRP